MWSRTYHFSYTQNRWKGVTLDKKYSGITDCKFEYRYQENSEGFHNYNDSSFFSFKLMVMVLNSWVEGVSLEIFLNIIQSNIEKSPKHKLDQHLIGDAAKH